MFKSCLIIPFQSNHRQIDGLMIIFSKNIFAHQGSNRGWLLWEMTWEFRLPTNLFFTCIAIILYKNTLDLFKELK